MLGRHRSFFLLGATSTGVGGTNGPKTRALVVDTSVSITLDGRLDEPVERDTGILKLVQQSPKPRLSGCNEFG
jgi:hypothetical protein